MTYYPIHSLYKLHVIGLNQAKTLCGITPPRYWEMSFAGEAFPEINDFDSKNKASKSEGFRIGWSFAPHHYFCKRCYNALKINRNTIPYKMSQILEYIKSAARPVQMAELKEHFTNPQKEVKALILAGKLEKTIYCFGSGGFDGMGFRTRPWTYVYSPTSPA